MVPVMDGGLPQVSTAQHHQKKQKQCKTQNFIKKIYWVK
jgi:hypothetical protein